MFSYYCQKIHLAIKSRKETYRYRLKKESGILYGPLSHPFTFSQTVAFAFWPPFVHLGDQLFHLPLIQTLRHHNIKVIILGPTPLDFLFSKLGCQLSKNYSLIHHTIIVSKFDCLPYISPHIPKTNYFIGLNYRKLPGNQRIGTLISQNVLHVLSSFISLSPQPLMPIPQFPYTMRSHWHHQLQQLSDKPILLFNNCVNSNKLSAFFRQPRLLALGKKKKKEGYHIVYIGEKKTSPAPSFISLDLRGMISIPDLFGLYQSDNVTGILSFDTFLAHIASLCKEKNIIVIARSQSMKQLIRNHYLPFFDYPLSKNRIHIQ